MMSSKKDKSHDAQLSNNKYRNKFSTTITLSQYLNLETRPPSAREYLSTAYEKVKRKAKQTSSRLCQSLKPKRKDSFDRHDNDNGAVVSPPRGSEDLINPARLCSVADGDHILCVPAIPQDYGLAVGHGIEDDHDSIDYEFDESVPRCVDWERTAVSNNMTNTERLGSDWSSCSTAETTVKQTKPAIREYGTAGGDTLDGHGPDLDSTEWLDIAPEQWEETRWLEILDHAFEQDEEEGAQQ